MQRYEKKSRVANKLRWYRDFLQMYPKNAKSGYHFFATFLGCRIFRLLLIICMLSKNGIHFADMCVVRALAYVRNFS